MKFVNAALASTLICLFFAILPLRAQQEWVRMMEDRNANFYDIQKSFNEYWEGKEIERGKGWKQFKRWEYFMEPRVYPGGKIPAPDQAARAYDQYLKSRGAIENSGFSDWTPLGPTSWLTNSYNPGIGRINCSAVHPSNSDIIYVGAPSGGLWISSDGGNSWNTSTDDLPVLGVTSVAIDPLNPDVVYIGTGDGDAGDTYSIGVLKSSDGGHTWNSTGLNWTIYQTRRISKLLIHPANPNVLLAAADNGVYKSTDSGQSWTSSLAGNFKDVEFKPGDPSTVYACGTSFYKSIDTGSSFSLSGSGLPSSAAVNRLAIAVTPANPEYVYVLGGSNANSGFYGLYRSGNSGNSFSLRSNSPNLLGWDPNGLDTGGQSWYDLSIAASPLNPEEIYVGGVNIWKSSNGGQNWLLNAYWFYPDPAPYVHADIHALDFHGNVLYAGCDGGIFRTFDGGANWIDISKGLANTQFYRIGGYPANDGLVIGGTQDNGSNLLNGGVWTHVLGADGMEAIIDYNNPAVMYACIQNGGLRRSTNGGLSFNSIVNNINENGAWVTPYVMDPFDSQTLYAGFSNVWKTTNRGASWTNISTSLGGGGLQSLAVAPSNSQYIYAAAQNGIYRTTDGGASWTSIVSGLPAGAAITYIAVSDVDPQKLWVTFSGYSAGIKIFSSTNAGNSWTNYSGTLPNLPANCVAHQANSNDALYVGTDIGVYYRNNSMPDWEPFINGLPNVIVQELEIHYASGKLRAGTFGRGLWESPLGPVAALISHTPLGDTEDISGPYQVDVEINPGSSPLTADSLLVYYSTDNSFSNTVPLLPAGGVNQYTGEIPGQGSDVTINYYIFVSDSVGLQVSDPPNAPNSYYSFYAGPDTVSPVISHTPILYADITQLPAQISAVVSDNIAIDTVWAEYSINGTAQPAFGLAGSANNYQGAFPFDSSTVSLGDIIEYRILARDASSNMNQAVSGPYQFDIRRVLSFSRSPNVPIPNNNPGGVTDIITIPGSDNLEIIDIDIHFKATHSNFGDFIVKLMSPSGSELTLIDRPGHPAQPLGNPGNDPDIMLNDAAAQSIEDVTFQNGEQVVGIFRPHPDLLGGFNGETAYGDWQITVIDAGPAFVGTFNEWELLISLGGATAIDPLSQTGLPEEFVLYQNYPNPFNPVTTIRYGLKESAKVDLKIYNVLGQEIRALVHEKQEAGYYSVQWNGENNAGAPVASGIYVYKITAGDFIRARKMLLLK